MKENATTMMKVIQRINSVINVGLYLAPILDLCILQMPQVVFTATFIKLILLAIVIIVKIKVCKKLKMCNIYFSFQQKMGHLSTY